MNTIVKHFSAVIFIASIASNANAAGFKKLQVSDPGYPDLTVGIWYPTDQPVPKKPNTEFELPVALNAPYAATNGGLIVISHGYGGWYAGHADTAAALADSGFVVAAPTHTGNTWRDMSSSIDQWILDRPRHVSRTIDHVLGNEEISHLVDSDKIGVYGFSAGGNTAMALIGATPNLDYAQAYCESQPEEFVCSENMIEAMRSAKMNELPATAWGHDPRVRAASIAAPGLGFTYTEKTLVNVKADVQLWSGERDTRVPTQSNAAVIAKGLQNKPETHWVDKANHFAFMVVNCRDAFKQNDPEEYEMVCGDAPGFDRYEFHDQLHAEMVRFFNNIFGAGNASGR